MPPIDLHLLIPQVARTDIDFLYKFLQLNPKHRSSALSGLQDDYFKVPPIPYLQSEFPCPMREKGLGHEKPSLNEEELRRLVREHFEVLKS